MFVKWSPHLLFLSGSPPGHYVSADRTLSAGSLFEIPSAEGGASEGLLVS